MYATSFIKETKLHRYPLQTENKLNDSLSQHQTIILNLDIIINIISVKNKTVSTKPLQSSPARKENSILTKCQEQI